MTLTIDPDVLESVLRENGIPPRPLALECISAEMRKDIPDLHVLERAISKDVAIAGGLIKMANSPYFGLRRHVRSVVEAMQLLGLKTTAQAVACVALRTSFPNLHLDRFWDASAQIAALSAWLVQQRRWKSLRSEDAYTLGLFRDCGIAILLQRLPAYIEVLRRANAEAVRPFTTIEEEVLPVAHTQIGAMMTQTWWLPDEITEAIRHHHDVAVIRGDDPAPGLGGNTGALIAVTQLAEHLFQGITGLSPTREWDKLGDACLARLQLAPSDLDALRREVQQAGILG